MKRIYINDNANSYYPVQAYWNKYRSHAVFRTVEEAKEYCIGRFGKCNFIDRRKEVRK